MAVLRLPGLKERSLLYKIVIPVGVLWILIQILLVPRWTGDLVGRENFEESQEISVFNDHSESGGIQQDVVHTDDFVDMELLDEFVFSIDQDFLEQQELDGRTEQLTMTYEEFLKDQKKADTHRKKLEVQIREDFELERYGQPLCIYEPYYGAENWPYLHEDNPLYRGLSMTFEGKRANTDDLDAVSRLPLLNDTYYNTVLCEFGAYLAMASHIDNVHKNSWIGFQTVSSQNASLSENAEASLLQAVNTPGNGDAVYFWTRPDAPVINFWSLCDSRNAGVCRKVFLKTFQRMYGFGDVHLPEMPEGVWALTHNWVMPTSSFVEFVLFSRIFLDSLDTLFYPSHHDDGRCPLANTELEARHCYCRMLDGLVNVWAYHSARKLFYVDPWSGTITEQHPPESRRGLMNINMFSLELLKGMDEDLAERSDTESVATRWLWPHTGEVFWRGTAERERKQKQLQKLEKRKRDKEKRARQLSKRKQKPLGENRKPKVTS